MGAQQQMRRAALLLLLVISWAASVLPAVQAHAGCGQQSPLAMKQQRALARRLQELRQADAAADAAAAAAAAADAIQAQQAQPAHRQLQQGAGSGTGASSSSGSKTSGSSSSRSSSGGAVSPQELRIGAVYQLSGLGTKEVALVENQLVPTAIVVLQRFLKVLRPPGAPKVPNAFYADSQQGSCIVGKASTAMAEAVKKNDLSLYVTAEATGCLPGMIAVATACEVDPTTKRPILGTLNICPSSLTGVDGLTPGSEAQGYALGRLVEVIVHEITHVLGFGSTHYEDWRGPDGKLYGRANVIVNKDGRPYLATPKVTKVARDYFGCPTLPGAPLENEGPSFSAISHFEYRLLQREMMSPARPIDRSRARLSAFTLAALEDSGWYAADYSNAEPLDWGRGAGCEFVLNTCWEFIDRNPGQPYFCGKGTVNQTRCTAAASGWGVCRSSAFTDSCLLVGKYSPDGAAAVRDDVAPSGADGRAAACYSPPQLEALQKAGSNGNLLPLLGGSFTAAPGDICYNLITQPKPSSGGGGGSGGGGNGGKPGCVIPEDCPPADKQQAQAVKQAERVVSESGSGQGRNPLVSLEALEARAPAVFTFYEHDAKQGSMRAVSSSDSSSSSSSDRTAVCVNVAEGLSSSSSSSSSSSRGGGGGGGGGSKPKRALLSLLVEAAQGVSSLLHLPPSSSSSSSSSGDGSLAAAASRSLLSASAADFTAVVQSGSSAAAAAAACTSSPVLCFRSSCDVGGQLFVEAQLPGSGTAKFACPSGKTVDLSKALPGRYLLGVLQCPSNQLVCETMGCGDCSPSGGVCSRGRCHCHMERFGPGCKGSLVPKL